LNRGEDIVSARQNWRDVEVKAIDPKNIKKRFIEGKMCVGAGSNRGGREEGGERSRPRTIPDGEGAGREGKLS